MYQVLDTALVADYIRGMRSKDEQPGSLENTVYRELRLLEEVDGRPNTSQRQIAHRLGIALGVANLLVRTLASKGYIKVTKLGWRRWAYVLTPAGISRKVHLTLAYVERFIEHYRRVRHLLREDLSSLPLNTHSKVAIIGTSELAELTYLALKDIGVDDIEVFERDGSGSRFLGMRVQTLRSLEPDLYAKIVIAVPRDVEKWREELVASGVTDGQVVEFLRPRAELAGGGRTKEPS